MTILLNWCTGNMPDTKIVTTESANLASLSQIGLKLRFFNLVDTKQSPVLKIYTCTVDNYISALPGQLFMQLN